ncbi:oligosaccharide flippase family protein [[Pseudomonas] boreopolis]|uniref:oligosaccharide flippase family protein n=1 Tax=Xanthomonas boreopolis TaxID=86183 RepID=UPI003DA12F54
MDRKGKYQHLLHVALLWGGSLAGAALTFVLQILLGRSLGPHDYGTFANALSQVTVLSQFAGFGLQIFWLRAFGEEGWQAQRWIPASLKFISLSSLVTLTAYISWVIFGPNESRGQYALIILSPAILGFAAIELVASKLQLEQRFSLLSAWNVAHNFFRLVLVAIILTAAKDIDRLIAVCTIYSFVAIAIIIYAYTQIREMGSASFSLKGHGSPIHEKNFPSPVPQISSIAKESWLYGLDAVLFLAYFQCSNILLKYMDGDKAAGQYFAAFTIMNAVYLLPTVLYTKYLLSRIHRWAHSNKSKLLRVFKLGSAIMLLAGILGTIAIWLIAPHVWGLLYGNEYNSALDILFVLALCAPLKFMSTSVGSILTTGRYIRARVTVKIIGVIACFILNIMLIPIYGVIGAAVATVIAELVILMLFIEVARRNYHFIFK